MSTEAQTGPLNCLGMGGTWVHMGNGHRKANWTANVQVGMCTRVAHGVSDLVFQSNCANRQTGRVGMGKKNRRTARTGSVAWAWGEKKIRRKSRTGRSRMHETTDGTVAPGRLRSSVSSATTDGTVARLLAVCARPCRLRSRTGRSRDCWPSAPVRVVCDHGQDGRAHIERRLLGRLRFYQCGCARRFLSVYLRWLFRTTAGMLCRSLKTHHGRAVYIECSPVQRLGEHVRWVLSGGDIVGLDDLILNQLADEEVAPCDVL